MFTWKAGNFTAFIFLVKENLVYLDNFQVYFFIIQINAYYFD